MVENPDSVLEIIAAVLCLDGENDRVHEIASALARERWCKFDRMEPAQGTFAVIREAIGNGDLAGICRHFNDRDEATIKIVSCTACTLHLNPFLPCRPKSNIFKRWDALVAAVKPYKELRDSIEEHNSTVELEKHNDEKE